MEEKKKAIYSRVANRGADNTAIEKQKEYIFDFVKRNFEESEVIFYSDDGYSGSNFDRPAFEKMMDDVRNRKIKAIVVQDLSRISRNMVDLIKFIERICDGYEVELYAIDNFNTKPITSLKDYNRETLGEELFNYLETEFEI